MSTSCSGELKIGILTLCTEPRHDTCCFGKADHMSLMSEASLWINDLYRYWFCAQLTHFNYLHLIYNHPIILLHTSRTYKLWRAYPYLQQWAVYTMRISWLSSTGVHHWVIPLRKALYWNSILVFLTKALRAALKYYLNEAKLIPFWLT